MRLSLAIAATLLLGATAHAQTMRPENLRIGYGIICDTAEQARRFISLRDSGREAPVALQTINTEAKATACGEAIVAFRLIEPKMGGPVHVVRIMVLAYSDGDRWSLVPETTQYAVVLPRGISI